MAHPGCQSKRGSLFLFAGRLVLLSELLVASGVSADGQLDQQVWRGAREQQRRNLGPGSHLSYLGMNEAARVLKVNKPYVLIYQPFGINPVALP
jgi:hypothetical protein